ERGISSAPARHRGGEGRPAWTGLFAAGSRQAPPDSSALHATGHARHPHRRGKSRRPETHAYTERSDDCRGQLAGDRPADLRGGKPARGGGENFGIVELIL